MSYEIRNAANVLIATVPGGAGPTYSASWTPPSNLQYKIRAVATDNTTLSTSTADVVVDVILPVTYLHFDAEKEQESVLLTWATATELNNDRFVIERSADGSIFEPIGTVAGKGNSITIFSYSFTDLSPLKGKSYYRLAQYDFDQSFEYSEVKTINYSADYSFTIAPNPFEDKTTLVASSPLSFTLKIFSLQGVLMEEKEYNEGNNSQEIGKNLPPGLYLITLITPNNSVTYKIEKLH